MQEQCEAITEWSRNNKIQFSKEKTNLVIFTNNKIKDQNLPKLTISNWEVKRIDKYKYLGLTLQQNGRWDTHFKEIINKVKLTNIWLHSHIRNSGQPNCATLVKILKATTQPQLTYGIEFWNPTKTQFRKMDSAIAQGYRAALQLSQGTSHNELRKELQIQTMEKKKEEAMIRLKLRCKAIEKIDHPAKLIVKQIDKINIAKGRTKRNPGLEFAIKTAKPVEEEKKPFKMPRYLNWDNPLGWLTAKIKFKQGWDYQHNNTKNKDLECGHPRCKTKGIEQSNEHVLLDCPEFDQVRQELSDKLWDLQVDFSMETVLGNYTTLTGEAIDKKKATQVDEIIKPFLAHITKHRPFTFWKKD
jgi:hypothetical protein